MLFLIFAIILGLGLAFFATQNTNGVTITLANTPLTDIPLWMIVIVAVLIGLVFASFFNIVSIANSMFRLRGKDATIKGADRTIENLKREIESLKVENASLRSKREPA